MPSKPQNKPLPKPAFGAKEISAAVRSGAVGRGFQNLVPTAQQLMASPPQHGPTAEEMRCNLENALAEQQSRITPALAPAQPAAAPADREATVAQARGFAVGGGRPPAPPSYNRAKPFAAHAMRDADDAAAAAKGRQK
jgi:hypothetical protein